jgi:parvulin-like peptidyl-prolyl isomerase
VYSLLRLEDAGLARELYLRINEGESDFAELAARYAEGPERTTRGVVGPVPLMQAHPVLAERLRTATPGVLMEPFRIEKWWLVVRLESFTPATLNDDTAEQMARELFEEVVEEAVLQRINQLIPLRFPEA